MELEFSGSVWYWRGPAPHYFVTVPDEVAQVLREAVKWVTYGWGMIPVSVTAGQTCWSTSLFPKDGGYIVPLKAAARAALDLKEGDTVSLSLRVGR